MPSPGRKRKKGGDKTAQATNVKDPEEERKKNEQRVKELENEYATTLARKQELQQNLTRVALPDAPGPAPRAAKVSIPVEESGSKSHDSADGVSVFVPHQVPLMVKTDTHWDFVLKEMQWLSTDFTAERKRHTQSRRKLTNGIKQYFKTKESRALAALTQAESKRRKLAAKMGRDVRKWWNKIDQVVTYQQKLTYDSERQKALNKKLVNLVQQTETYTKSLVVASKKNHDKRKRKRLGETVESDEEDDEQMHQLKIEEALAVGQRKRKIHDYSRLEKEAPTRSELYGESTTDDSGSDASFELGSESSEDDETTLAQAEREEQLERNSNGSASFVADPVEIQKLQEESTMSIEVVLERLRQEPPTIAADDAAETNAEADQRHEANPKRVQFANVPGSKAAQLEVEPMHKEQEAESDPGDDADDDGDASDVEDFVGGGESSLRALDSGHRPENDDGDDDEFFDRGLAVDDETTMEEEERLPQDMSAQEEISLLEQENNMSVEELRARYAAVLAGPRRPEDIEADAVDENANASSGNSDAETGDDEEFQVDAEDEVDDETTMEAEEKLGRDMSYKEELEMLQRENAIPVEELRALYSQMDAEKSSNEEGDSSHLEAADESRGNPRKSRRRRIRSAVDERQEDSGDTEEDAEFQPDPVGEVDDETTIAAEERLEREMSYSEEIAMLQQENEMTVDELRAIYMGATMESENDAETADPKFQDADNGTHSFGKKTPRSSKRKRSGSPDGTRKAHKVDEDQETGPGTLSSLEQSAELAKSTLATRPFLLANWVKLREYQQIGLNWLVSMQARRLNGILADEMGLGKTLQTIALLSYLASYKGIWGPHLVVVPTSVIVNWETEFKRFCPGLKVLCYYGSAKQRKELRTGWTKTNWNHVVITSYQLAVQDAFAFKRKRWYYLVLDEAQNIKNFQSQRWQTLINFNTQRRLLLTGTPLQNSLMELWSLLHFLMPYIFRSRKEFSFWFENPMNDMIDGTTGENANVIGRLHGIIRPFVLRRLKKDVETQMPGKYEHIVKCSLSRRQMLMYEEFMARSSTRRALRKGGNFMGMMNVLMQLRKVCNHPDLFEPRSIVTPFVLDPVEIPLPSCIFALNTNQSVFRRISTSLLVPLWCGSQGEPTVKNACQHDKIEAEQLQILRKPVPAPPSTLSECQAKEELSEELIKLETNQQRNHIEDHFSTIMFLNTVSMWRCQALPFCYSGRLLRCTKLLPCASEHSNTLSAPTDLLKMRKNQKARAAQCDDLIKKFVFCVPKAGVRSSSHQNRPNKDKSFDQMLIEPVEEYMQPFTRARARLSSFFPDKKLIQFDAGKLQTLAELLRELKRGGHRTLIFTQMSKMLDILEAFLNIHGYTYMRLDGSTGVDRRQRMMDRFNNDPRIFCFILSTRSGGTGVNLIGADTVVFYDSDWNPAMDAQAQDRVHRIGQTRDCHVYRLVTEHSIEENILIKAKQKKNLDILVMDRGKFDSSHLFNHDHNVRLSLDNTQSQEMKDVYTKGGLRAILGVSGREDDEEDVEKEVTETAEVEKAMEELEDNDDVEALKGAKKEAAEELQEFDEDQDTKTNELESVGKEGATKKERDAQEAEKDEETEKKELEEEFQSWQTKVGMDKDAIEASLSPAERYGFKFRTDIDPYVSLYAVLEYKRQAEEEEEEEDRINIDEIEREKSYEERQALADGDLLGTDPRPSDLIRLRSLYQRENARMKTSKKRRTLTGENWETRTDARFDQQFWYNVDTGEAIWDKPRTLVELEEYELALDQKWSALPLTPLVHIMSFLQPFPDRLSGAAPVCRQWRLGATHPSFVLHVYPVEMGAYTRDDKKIEFNHFRTLPEALKAAKPGDTIELGDGHYWVNEDLHVPIPIRIVGDEHNPSRVVVEMSGSRVVWRAKGGWMEGITFRSPKLNTTGEMFTKNLFSLENGRLNVYHCAFEGSISVSGASGGGYWENVTICGVVEEEHSGSLVVGNRS